MWHHELYQQGRTDPAMQETNRQIQEELSTGEIGLDTRAASLFRLNQATILAQRPENQRSWLQRIASC
jgi:hypothetical protein